MLLFVALSRYVFGYGQNRTRIADFTDRNRQESTANSQRAQFSKNRIEQSLLRLNHVLPDWRIAPLNASQQILQMAVAQN